MLIVDLNRENYEYDVHALVKSFFPEEQVTVLTPESREDRREELSRAARIRINVSGREAVLAIDGREYRLEVEEGARAQERLKEGFKKFLYQVLSKETGKELPWGNLTGIRPTKIAYGFLEEGRSREEIIRHYQEKHFVSTGKAALSVDIAARERELLSRLHRGGYGEAGYSRDSGKAGYSQDSGKAGYSRGFGEAGYSLYVGIPFCPTTCLYCSFTSFPIGGYRKIVDAYIDCLIREMDLVAGQYAGRTLDCVYIGGGTPTTLEAEQLDRLITALKDRFDFSTVQEFTVEAGRADSITPEKLQVLYRQKVTRISVNPQTMKQETLDIIGRNASVKQVEEAYALARQTGFDNINMDLILGLPGELEADVQRTIDRVVELAPDSLTVHSLAVKRASRLNRWIQENRAVMLHNTDETMEIAARGAARLGMVPYYLYRQKNMSGNLENVGYAREGKLGLYNILIMEEVQTVMALGAGSITKLVLPDGRIERRENVKDVKLYLEKLEEMLERKRELFALESSLEKESL